MSFQNGNVTSPKGLTEVLKEYEYTNKDGKSVKIKRKYTIEGSSKRKQKELDEFFSNNADRINTNTKIKALLDEYNDSHEMKISYSMFYTTTTELLQLLRSFQSWINELR